MSMCSKFHVHSLSRSSDMEVINSSIFGKIFIDILMPMKFIEKKRINKSGRTKKKKTSHCKIQRAVNTFMACRISFMPAKNTSNTLYNAFLMSYNVSFFYDKLKFAYKKIYITVSIDNADKNSHQKNAWLIRKLRLVSW